MQNIPHHWLTPILILLIITDGIGLLGINTGLFLGLQQVFAGIPDGVWAAITILGDALIVTALLSLLALRNPNILPLGFVAGIIATLLNRPLKLLLNVDRPFLALNEHLHVIGNHLQHFSFPSGHTTAIFMFAGVYTITFSSQKVFNAVFWLALLVGLSRIAVGAHWPMDVGMGAAVGWAAALMAWKLLQYRQWQQRVMQSRPWQLSLWAISLSAAIASFFLHTDYPQALNWQYALAVCTTIAALWGFWQSWHHPTP